MKKDTLPPEPFTILCDDTHIRRERQKARELRQTEWWKRRCVEGVCYYCHRRLTPRKLTMDHIVPMIRVGVTINNKEHQ